MGAQRFVAGEQYPEQTGMFVGDGDQGLVVADALVGGDHPGGEAVSSLGAGAQGGLQGRACALDQQAAQVVVAAAADATQTRLAAGGVLPRGEAQPGGELAPAAELGRIGDGGRQCAGGQDSDPAQARGAQRARIVAGVARDLAIAVGKQGLDQVSVGVQ